VLQKKVDTIDKKIEDLNAQKKKIETDIAHQILHVIKSHSGFTLPFYALVGGLIEVIQTSKSDPSKMEEWQTAGEKFQRSRGRSKSTPKQQPLSNSKAA
jgi:hypothetical protein